MYDVQLTLKTTSHTPAEAQRKNVLYLSVGNKPLNDIHHMSAYSAGDAAGQVISAVTVMPAVDAEQFMMHSPRLQ
jgi:hypothetical protein